MKLTEQDIIEYYEGNNDSDFATIYESVGAKAALELITSHSGCVIYIPIIDNIIRKKRDKQIKQDYYEKGFKINQLAKIYGVTTRTIYNVLRTK